jgi:hypothetical protein
MEDGIYMRDGGRYNETTTQGEADPNSSYNGSDSSSAAENPMEDLASFLSGVQPRRRTTPGVAVAATQRTTSAKDQALAGDDETTESRASQHGRKHAGQGVAIPTIDSNDGQVFSPQDGHIEPNQATGTPSLLADSTRSIHGTEEEGTSMDRAAVGLADLSIELSRTSARDVEVEISSQSDAAFGCFRRRTPEQRMPEIGTSGFEDRQERPDPSALQNQSSQASGLRSTSDVRDIILPRWQPDAEVTYCPICRTQFSFFVRKHHCR